MRKITLAVGEFYHVYNRGVDKRIIFLDDQDFSRFLQSMVEFNNREPVGGLYMNSFRKNLLRHRMSKGDEKSKKEEEKLVEIIAYCLNPNHFHLLLRQVSEKGVEKFMQRLGNGYTKYFNYKYERTGVLLQGKFKAAHVDSNEYLLHLSAYINLNYRVHQLRHPMSQWRSSWDEYMGKIRAREGLCCTDPIREQFRNKEEQREFSENSLRGILENRGYLAETALLE